jgi:uroporphyrinogen-III decarboxylase
MLISREQYVRFFKDRYAKIYHELKKTNKNILFAHHCDGYVEPIIRDFIEIGLDILNPIQPQCMDPVKIKKKYGKDLSFWGTIDNQRVIPFGTDEELYSELTQIMKNVAPGGGLILGGAHCIQPNHISEKNLVKMVEFIRKNGTYPIKL